MTTFTIRVSSSATNTSGTAYGQQPDLGAPSFLDMVVTGSTDPVLVNGRYDAYCLNPILDISVNTAYSATNSAGNSGVAFTPIGFGSLSQGQVDRLNWLLAQNFTSDAKFAGQFNFGEVQMAIWKIVGFTDAQIESAGLDRFLSDNNRQVVSTVDVEYLLAASQAAVASGNGVVPSDAYFTEVIDPAGDVQPLIVQLQSGKIGNFVWADGNANGVQDVGEAGVDRVIVELYDGSGNLIASTLTGDDYSTATVEHGYYQFTGLKAGNYQVKCVAPAYNFTVKDVSGNGQDSVDSDADAAGLTGIISLAAGGSNQSLDVGLLAKVLPGAISGTVYHDTNNDGLINSADQGIAGATVTLTGTDDRNQPVSVSVTTDANGNYSFEGLRPGSYTVTETTPAGYLDGRDTAGTNGASVTTNDTIAVTLGAGQSSTANNFGEVKPASLAGHVFFDANDDGSRSGDTGIGGVTITLTGTDDLGASVTLTTTTLADGSYQFDNLRPGTYTVNEGTVPAAYLDGKDTAGTIGGVSVGAVSNDQISAITLKSGDASIENNFGEIAPGSVKGTVYHDTNNDGLINSADQGIAGATVTLTGTDDRNQPVSVSVTTDANGNYSFEGLRPGSYTVTETTPAGYLDGRDTAGTNGASVTTNDTIAVTLGAGQSSTANNFGEVKPASLAGHVFFDANDDGSRSGDTGIGGVTITLTGTDDLGASVTLTTTTLADGSYQFDNLRPGTYAVNEGTVPAAYLDGKDTAGTIGGVSVGAVSNDQISAITLKSGEASIENNFGEIAPGSVKGTVYHDTNNDGLINSADQGIAGATVTLTGTDDRNQPVNVSVTTDANGNYSFEGLRPGSYTVTETTPAGYLDGRDTAGTNGASVTTNDTIAVTLGAGQSSTANNFGEVKPASLAGHVFFDANDDGSRSGDTGIAGVTITLTGTDDLGASVTLTTTTLADGSYKFDNLRPGTYTVNEGTVPAAYLDGKDTAGTIGGVSVGAVS
ncbi:SdrD B-like domain-containing protein, partial [Ideonella sp. DXS22W]